jgi:hypothetical protein
MLRRALADTFGISIFPDMRWENRLMSFIDIIANRLSNQMVGDRESCKAVI